MAYLKASIFKDDKLLFDNIIVCISVSIEPNTGFEDWHGSFEIPISEHIEPGGPYRIELEDGRVGEFNVSDINMNIEPRGQTEVYFSGTGPLK